MNMMAPASTTLPLGTRVPDFTLTDVVSGAGISPADFEDRPALLVMFLCNHCPYVVHLRKQIGRLTRDYHARGVGVIAINSNDAEASPQDAPPHMAELVREEGWQFPFVFDEDQRVAKAFMAACTPEFFVFDGRRRLMYRGQLDDSRPRSDVPVTGRDVRNALDAVLTQRPVLGEQKPSVGCGIKWKEGNAPPYIF